MTLVDYLSANKLTQAQFALMIGTSQAAVTRYATGKRFPDRRVLEKIQRATKGEVTPNDFLASVSIAPTDRTEAA